MSNTSGPKITIDGLVFNLDFANRKSYTGTGANCYDLKNDLSGTLTNGPVFSNVQNGVMNFDGTNDYIRYLSNSNFSFGTGSFTIECWVYFNVVTTYSPFIQNDTIGASNNTKWWFAYNSSQLRLGQHGTANGAYCSWSPSANNWYHVVVTRSGTTVSMYINGVSQTVTSNIGSTSFGENGLSIGGMSTPYYLNGKIGQIRIYKGKSLSSTEIKSNYTATAERYVERPRTISGLQLWLDAADFGTLRQSSGGTTAVTANNDPVGYWGDKSGNGRNALQATAGNRPIFYSANSMIQFDGVSQLIELASTLALSDMTIFWVGVLNETPSYTVSILHGPNALDALNMYTTGYYWYQGIDILQVVGGSPDIWQSNIISISQITRSGSSWSVKHNNVNRVVSAGLSNTANIKGIGKAYSGYSQIRVGEMIVYNRNLTQDEIRYVSNYLNKKWSIS